MSLHRSLQEPANAQMQGQYNDPGFGRAARAVLHGEGGARSRKPSPCGHADRPVMKCRTFAAKLATSIGFER